jgi:hypothetical protein
VNARGVVSRSLVDGRLSLSSFQAIPDAQHQFVSRYALNRTHVDAYITGMHVSQEGDNMLYYTTQLGIYAYNTKTAGTLRNVFFVVSFWSLFLLQVPSYN